MMDRNDMKGVRSAGKIHIGEEQMIIVKKMVEEIQITVFEIVEVIENTKEGTRMMVINIGVPRRTMEMMRAMNINGTRESMRKG